MHELADARIAALQRMPIFGGLRGDVLQFLLDRCKLVELGAGQFFFRQEDAAEALYVLEAGRVAIFKLWDGADYLLSYLNAGDCFGEMALMDMSPRSASVQAVEPCIALELSAGRFFELYEKDLEQFALIQMNLGREVSRRLRAADDRLFRLRMLGK